MGPPCRAVAAIVKAISKCSVPPCKVPPRGYPPKVGPSRSYPATPPWTLGRKVGSDPTTPPWTFAGNVGGGGGDLGTQGGGGGPPCDRAIKVRRSGCALAGTSAAPGGTVPARGRPANDRRRSPAVRRRGGKAFLGSSRHSMHVPAVKTRAWALWWGVRRRGPLELERGASKFAWCSE